MTASLPTADQLRQQWASDPRWAGIERPYTAEDVVRLRGSVAVEHSLARLGAEKLWNHLEREPFVNALGALTGNQAMQQVKAGLKAIYLSGWQVAADANLGGQMYPDQSLYPADSVPAVVKRINNTLLRRRTTSSAVYGRSIPAQRGSLAHCWRSWSAFGSDAVMAVSSWWALAGFAGATCVAIGNRWWRGSSRWRGRDLRRSYNGFVVSARVLVGAASAAIMALCGCGGAVFAADAAPTGGCGFL